MIDAKRVPNWRSRLAAVLNIDETKPFAWGSHDCFLGLVVPAIEATVGIDIGGDFRGAYDTAEGARAALAAAGFSDLAEAAGAYFPEIPPAMAHIGDVAVIPSGSDGLGVGLGIVIGERIAVLSELGKATVRLGRATRAFRVG